MATRREWISGLVLAGGTALTACVITAAAQEEAGPIGTGGPPAAQPTASAPLVPATPADPLTLPAADRRPNDLIRPAPGGGFSTFRSGFGPPGGSFGGFSSRSTNDESRSTSDETDEMRQARTDALLAEIDAQAAAQELTAAKEEATKSEARAKLRAALQRQFETRQKHRDLEIAQLEAEVKRLRDTHQKREAAKSQIIDARLDQLVRSAEGLGWDANTAFKTGTPADRSAWSTGGTSSSSAGPNDGDVESGLKIFELVDSDHNGQASPQELGKLNRLRPAFEKAGIRLDDEMSKSQFVSNYVKAMSVKAMSRWATPEEHRE